MEFTYVFRKFGVAFKSFLLIIPLQYPNTHSITKTSDLYLALLHTCTSLATTMERLAQNEQRVGRGLGAMFREL